MSWGPGVNFYGCSGSAGTGGLTSASSQTAAAAADAKLDGIYNLLTSQNQHMLVLQEQGQQALQEIGHLCNRVGYLESKLEKIESKQQTLSGVEQSCGSTPKHQRLPPSLCVSLWYNGTVTLDFILLPTIHRSTSSCCMVNLRMMRSSSPLNREYWTAICVMKCSV